MMRFDLLHRWARRALLLALLALTAATAGCPSARRPAGTPEDPLVWRFAIEESAGSVQDAYAQAFKRKIETRSGGAIQVKVYPYGTLGTSDHITELLHNGTLQFAMASPGHLGKLLPEVQVFLLHFVLDADDEVNRAALADAELLDYFDALYAKKGFKLLSLYTEGEMVWTTRQPIRRPEDFDGVKIRTMTSPLLLAAYEAYGASATPLPYAEVYSALQLNMIDGQVNPVFAIQEMSFYEVTDWLIFPGHAQFVTSAASNRAFYEGLSAERRALLDDVIAELHREIFTIQREYNEDRLALIRERRPEIQTLRLSKAERAPFRTRAEAVARQFEEMVGDSGGRALAILRGAVRRAGGE